MVKELDDYVRDNDVTDWELDFISDMMNYRLQKRTYSTKQREQIVRLVEKFL